MDWSKVIFETFKESFSTLFKLTYIIIPLLIFIECLKDAGVLAKVSKYCRGVTKFLKLPGESALGITVGLFIGLVFGSGVIMQIREDVKMSKFQLNVMFAFVGICHAIIEETVVFTAIGAYGPVLIMTRFMMALIFSLVFIRIAGLAAVLRKKNIVDSTGI